MKLQRICDLLHPEYTSKHPRCVSLPSLGKSEPEARKEKTNTVGSRARCSNRALALVAAR